MDAPAQSYFSVIGRHWILLAIITILPTILAVVLVIWVLDPIYEGKASVIFPLKTASSFMRRSLTDMELPISGMSSLLSATPTLYNHIAIIESRTLAKKVDEYLKDEHDIDLLSTYKGILEDPELETDEERYRACLKKMMKEIDVDDSDRGMAIILFRHKDPEIAAATANAYITETLAFLNEVNQLTQTDLVAFLEARQIEVEDSLQNAEAEIQAVKEETGILSVEEHARQLISSYADLEAMVTQAEIDYEGSKSQARSMEEAGMDMGNYYAWLASGREPGDDIPAPAIDALADQTIARLRAELNTLELDLQTRMLYETPENPEIIVLEQQIDAVRRELYREFTDYFDASIASLVVESTAYEAQLSVASEILTELDAELDTFPPEERRLIELERDRDVQESIYLVITQELEQARIQEMRDTEPFTVLDMALVPTKPVEPRKVLISGGTFAIAFWLGIFIIFSLDARQRRRIAQRIQQAERSQEE